MAAAILDQLQRLESKACQELITIVQSGESKSLEQEVMRLALTGRV